jgi:hypothetical protein
MSLAECHYAECRYAECQYAERHYAERHYAECPGVYQHCVCVECLTGNVFVSISGF